MLNLTNDPGPDGEWCCLDHSSPVCNQYLKVTNASAMESFNVTWDDPMADVSLTANELAFRTPYPISACSQDC